MGLCCEYYGLCRPELCMCRNNMNYQIRHSVFGLLQYLNCSTLLASLPSLPIEQRRNPQINRPHKCTMVIPTVCIVSLFAGLQFDEYPRGVRS
jgi:hypothetical protein